MTIAKLVLLIVVFMALLAGCDTGPQPAVTATQAPVPTAVVAATPSAVPSTSTPFATEAPCTTPAVTGKLNLLPLPGIVDEPVAMAMLNARIYVAGRTSNTIAVIENGQLGKVIPIGQGQTALIADQVLGKLFVLHGDGTMLSMLDGDGVQATMPITNPAKGPFQGALRMVGDTANHLAYIGLNTERPDTELVIVDMRSFGIRTRVSLPDHNYIEHLAIDSVNLQLLVSNLDAANHTTYISRLDMQSLTWIDSVRLPGDVGGHFLLYDPQSQRAYADYTENRVDHRIAVIERGKLVSTVPISAATSASQLVGNRLYLSNPFSPTVALHLPTLQTVATIDVDAGPNPSALLADPSGERLYIAVGEQFSPEYSRLEVVDLKRNQVIGVIPLTGEPRQLIADARRNRLYALMGSARSVMISDGLRVLARVQLERTPYQMVLDESTGKLYITELGSVYGSGYLDVVDVETGRLLTRKLLSAPASALAIDKAHNRLLVGDGILALDSLAPLGQFKVVEMSRNPVVPHEMAPQMMLVNPSIARVYAAAWNGIMGGNGGNQLYMLDGETLAPLASDNSTTVTAMVLDDATQRLYVALTYNNETRTELTSFDALQLHRIAAVALSTWVNAMTLNPATHHLFIAHGHFTSSEAGADSVDVLDTRTLIVVTPIKLTSEPKAVAVLGDRAFVATRGDTDLTVIRDCMLPAPPPATPLPTPTAIAAPP